MLIGTGDPIKDALAKAMEVARRLAAKVGGGGGGGGGLGSIASSKFGQKIEKKVFVPVDQFPGKNFMVSVSVGGGRC